MRPDDQVGHAHLRQQPRRVRLGLSDFRHGQLGPRPARHLQPAHRGVRCLGVRRDHRQGRRTAGPHRHPAGDRHGRGRSHRAARHHQAGGRDGALDDALPGRQVGGQGDALAHRPGARPQQEGLRPVLCQRRRLRAVRAAARGGADGRVGRDPLGRLPRRGARRPEAVRDAGHVRRAARQPSPGRHAHRAAGQVERRLHGAGRGAARGAQDVCGAVQEGGQDARRAAGRRRRRPGVRAPRLQVPRRGLRPEHAPPRGRLCREETLP